MRLSLGVTVMVALVCGSARLSPAQSFDPRREIASAEDFRVRVSAALALGRSKSPEARSALERALTDSHPTVRTAAAAALGAMGDPAAIPALERRLDAESSGSVRSQLRSTIDKLRGREEAAPAVQGPGKARYALKLGAMRNLSGVRGPELGNVLRVSAERRVSTLPGALLVPESGAPPKGGVPVLVLDGSLTRLAQQSHANGSFGVTAQVEFTVRKVPENTLRGALSGAATSMGTTRSVAGAPKRIHALQDQAVEGAVESAMRGADMGLSQAAGSK